MIRLLFLLFFLGSSLSIADDKRTQDIAILSASSVYDLDIKRLPKVLNNFLEKNKDLQAIEIIDVIGNETIFSYYINNSSFIFQKKIPKKFKEFNKYESDIIYDNEIIGKVIAFYKSTQNKIQFSENEKKWLSNNPISRIAIMNYWPHDDDDNSLHTEVLKLINKYAGTNLIPIKFNAWSNGFSKAVLGDDIVGIMGLSWSKKRENEYFFYTPTYDFTPSYLITRKDNDSIKSISDLRNRTVYLKENSITHKLINDVSPSIKIIDKKTIPDMYVSLSQNEGADAIVSYFIDEFKLDQYNLKLVQTNYERYGEVAIGVNHKYPELASIIKKAFETIPKTKLSQLRDKKWINKIKYKNLIISAAEKKWLDKNEKITYVYDPDWKPFEWMDDLDHHSGIIADLIKLITQKSGIDFKPINSKTWTEATNKVVSKEVQMFSAVGETTQRLKYLNYTKNKLYSTPYIFVGRQGEKYIDGLAYVSNEKIAVLKDSSIHEILKEKYPKLKLILMNTPQDGFEQLKNKEIDIFIVNAATAKYYINILGYKELRIAFKTKENLDLKIALRKDLPKEAISVIDKTIDTISEKELSDIFHKWTDIKIRKETNWVLIGQISAVILFILIFIVISNRKLKVMVEEKTSELNEQKNELESLVNSFDKNVIASKTDANGYITYASEAFCRISGYTQEELLGKEHKFMRHPDMDDEIFEELWEAITSNKTWVGEIKSLKKDGGHYWAKSFISPIVDSQNNVTEYSAIRHDITAKKEVEDLSVNLENKVIEKTRDLNKQLKIVTEAERKQYELLEEIQHRKKDIEQILSNILLPILITSKKDRVILYANKYAEIQYKMPLDELVGSNIDDIYTANNQKEHLIEMLQTKGHVENLEEVFKTFDGEEFIALLSVTPINYKGEDSYIGMVTDITKQKEQEKEVRTLHQHTKDSIEYASLIQGALIPNDDLFKEYFKDYFVIWNPKDIVGGDIYLFEQLRHEDECLLMVIDCTGHGVPGAFVTMLVKAVEREVISKIMSNKDMDVSPAWVMKYFNKTLKKLLQQETKDSISNAGWDGQVFYYNKKEKIAKFASARNSIFYIQENELKEIKGNRHSVGYKDSDVDYEFTEHNIKIKEETRFYISSDGYWDQMGGEKNLSFGKKRFKQLINEIYNEPMATQKEKFLNAMKEYQGAYESNDDVTVIGIKI